MQNLTNQNETSDQKYMRTYTETIDKIMGKLDSVRNHTDFESVELSESSESSEPTEQVPYTTEQIVQIAKSSLFYKPKGKKTFKLACYCCLSKYSSNHIHRYEYDERNGVKSDDLPLCPECSVDSVINYNKLPGKTDKSKDYLLIEINKIMFGKK